MQVNNEHPNLNSQLLKEVYAAWQIKPHDLVWKKTLHAALLTIPATDQERKDIYYHIQNLLNLETHFK